MIATLGDVLTENEQKKLPVNLNLGIELRNLTAQSIFDLYAVVKWKTNKVSELNAVNEVWSILAFRAKFKGKQIFEI